MFRSTLVVAGSMSIDVRSTLVVAGSMSIDV